MVKNIIDSVEKVFRYLLPGVIAIFLLRLCFPVYYGRFLTEMSNLEGKHLGISGWYVWLSAVLGMIIYSVYRFVMEFFDYILIFFLYLFNGEGIKGLFPKTMADIYKQSQENIKERLAGYIYYKLAINHFCLILSLLIISSIYWREAGSPIDKWQYKNTLFKLSQWFFLFSLAYYVFMSFVQKYIRDNPPSS